jgi:hypothetical protein
MFKLIVIAVLSFLAYLGYLKYFTKSENSLTSLKSNSSSFDTSKTKRFYITSLAFLLLIFFNSSLSFGQAKENNRIILWDVTASMVGSTPNGYNSEKDIDKKVREGLIKLIGEFENDNTSFRIMPFNSDILDYSKIFECSADGKSKAINYINGYKIDPKIKGYTNICAAWEKAHRYIDKAKSNYIYLYTDGEQNVGYGEDGKNCMQGLVEKYCELTKGSCFTYLISIKANNTLDYPSDCGIVIDVADPNTDNLVPHSLSLTVLNTTLVHNLKDGLSQVVRFKKSGNRKLEGFVPTGKLTFSNPAYSFDVKFTLVKEYEDGTVDFKLSFVDYSQNTVKRMKGAQKLNETATLALESSDREVTFDPASLQVIFKYQTPKPAQKVTIKID